MDGRWVAFLRGINLGNRRLKMDELRGHVAGADPGLSDVDTYGASGNVIFDHDGADAAALEELLESHLEDALGFTAETFVRSMAELEGLLERPELTGVREEGFKPQVIFVRGEVGGEVPDALSALETPDDRFLHLEGEIVWLRRGGLTESDIEHRHLESALGGAPSTMRTLNTVRRIAAKYGG